MPAEESKPQAPDQPAKAEAAKPAVGRPRKRRRWMLLGVLLVILALVVGIPKVLHALNTVSTDDAYVNSYVTFVAPRVAGQVARVLVEDNNRVKKGDVLVELDPEPYQVQVAIKQAAVDSAQAELVVAEASARGSVAQTRSARFKLIRTIEDVDNQIAIIRARVATWEQNKATLVLAQAEFDRAEHLLATKVVSAEEYDQKRETLDVAKAQVEQALENIYEARVALGLPAEPPAGSSLADVPANLGSDLLVRPAGARRSAPERRQARHSALLLQSDARSKSLRNFTGAIQAATSIAFTQGVVAERARPETGSSEFAADATRSRPGEA